MIMTLSGLLHIRAKEHPGSRCIRFEKRDITYSQLDRLVSATASGLASLGLKQGDRAAVLMENCPEYIVSYFAIQRAGGITVPVNTFLTPEEIAYIVNDSGCRVLIYSSGFSSHAEKIKDGVHGIMAVLFSDIPDGPAPENDLFASVSRDDDPAVLLYTSGTTGFPKGAMLSHRNLISNAEACKEVMQIARRDRILLFLPLFHAFSFTVCVLLPIYAGAQIILLRSVRPFSKVINAVLRDRVTFFVAVPTVYNILVKRKIPLLIQYVLRYLINIRACVSGAAALPEETLRSFEQRFRIPLIEGYGMTEASPVISVNPLKGARKPASVGLPLPGVEVAVAADDGRMLSRGETGELIVKGQNIMKGYFNSPEQTAAVIRDGWLYTGDIARVDDDGYIYIVDRKKDIIIIDGMNVYPKEVEDLVIRHPSVEECAMVGVPDGRGSEVPVLFVRKKDDAAVQESELREHMKGRIAQFKSPRRIVFVDDLPKTATGKIKKSELKKNIQNI